MDTIERTKHWENIYKTKHYNEVSWHQSNPTTSLMLIKQHNIPLHAKIIDIGGGDSVLVDHLLDLGYTNISVLDISETAIDRAKLRLGKKSQLVNWIIADIATFKPSEKFDFWHDRAAFHFLTQEKEIEHYLHTAEKSITDNGILVIGTFSKSGPEKCSGIEIKQYSEDSMTGLFTRHFTKTSCVNVDHITPFDTIQHFTFCSFKKQ